MNVFIAGPRAISKLNRNIEDRLYNIYSKNITVFVGDANGIDRAVQEYFCKLQYENLYVFASQGKARNNLGNWPVQNVEVPKNVKGFDFYATKDMKMAENADYGFMLWNGKSKGTLNNIINLLNRHKKSLVYFTPQNAFYCVDSYNKLHELLNLCSVETKTLFKELAKVDMQMSLF